MNRTSFHAWFTMFVSLAMKIILATLLMFQSLAAIAQGMVFVGREPEVLVSAKRLNVAKGILPGIPLLFEALEDGLVRLRTAAPEEVSTRERPTYYFERGANGAYVFFEIAQLQVLGELDRQNASDSASDDGKAFEKEVLMLFLDNGKVLQHCLSSVPKGKLEALTIYVVVAAGGALERAIVQPEGSVAQCVVGKAPMSGYGGQARFVAKARLGLAP